MRQGFSAGGGLAAELSGVTVYGCVRLRVLCHRTHTHNPPRGLHKCKDNVATACHSTWGKVSNRMLGFFKNFF